MIHSHEMEDFPRASQVKIATQRPAGAALSGAARRPKPDKSDLQGASRAWRQHDREELPRDGPRQKRPKGNAKRVKGRS